MHLAWGIRFHCIIHGTSNVNVIGQNCSFIIFGTYLQEVVTIDLILPIECISFGREIKYTFGVVDSDTF